MSPSQFPWPPMPFGDSPPVWNGETFLLGGGKTGVVSYTVASSNWSEELTDLHENEVGHDHPLDVASRCLAVQSLMRVAAVQPDLIDIGCSSGFLLRDLQREFPAANVMGADFILAPLERLAASTLPVPLLQFDLRECPLPDNCMDGVACLNVLEHIDDDARALGHIYRILRSGGVAHIEVPAGPDLYDAYDDHLMHHRRYTMRQLTDLARKTGFAVERSTHLGFFPFPGFVWYKMRNRRRIINSAEDKARLVANQLQESKASRLLALLMKIETLLGSRLDYPCGIRCVAVLRKS